MVQKDQQIEITPVQQKFSVKFWHFWLMYFRITGDLWNLKFFPKYFSIKKDGQFSIYEIRIKQPLNPWALQTGHFRRNVCIFQSIIFNFYYII